jgi:hypothetical protein
MNNEMDIKQYQEQLEALRGTISAQRQQISAMETLHKLKIESMIREMDAFLVDSLNNGFPDQHNADKNRAFVAGLSKAVQHTRSMLTQDLIQINTPAIGKASMNFKAIAN